MIPLFTGVAQAAEVLTCDTVDETNLHSHLRVYEAENGYAFEATSCQGLAHSLCSPYSMQGTMERDSKALMTFKNGNFQQVSVYYGDYIYSDRKENGTYVLFPHDSCRLTPVGEGDASEPSAVNDACGDREAAAAATSKAEAQADADAEEQCNGQKPARISDFDLSFTNKFYRTICEVKARASYLCP